MKVITDVFFIEREQLVICHSLYIALNDSTPNKLKDLITPFREWLGMQEGESCFALSDKQFTAPTLDPVKPIRIVVQNGNVTLVGVVVSQGDKDVAGLRANGVPGVFKVTNDLQVANQQSERN